MSTNTTERENPLLQIDTSFRTYLNAYTRSYQNHIVDGVLDYAFESDFAVRQKIMGLGGLGESSSRRQARRTFLPKQSTCFLSASRLAR